MKAKIEALERLAKDESTTPAERQTATRLARRLRKKLTLRRSAARETALRTGAWDDWSDADRRLFMELVDNDFKFKR